jgi:hypothetical protein
MEEFERRFREPDAAYSTVPLWFWFGKLSSERLVRQMEEMADKGVYGAFMHARPFLTTPYLEDEWWEAVAAVVERAAEIGFRPWLYDEYAWPSGTAGSIFRYGGQKFSRILARGRQHMAQGLKFREKEIRGPAHAEIYIPGIPDTRVAALLTPVNERGQYLHDRSIDVSGKWGESAHVTDGSWKLAVFYACPIPHMVNYLNPETIRLFIESTHEEYRKRFGSRFGSTIPGLFFDEIFNAGSPIVWTDGFERRFEERTGYSLRPHLPLLIGEGADPERTRRLRRDYFAVLTGLYEEAFFRQISDWCEKNGLMLTGHTEEDLGSHPLRQGDYFRTQRHLHIPGADCHDYRYRYPRKITLSEPKGAVGVARLNGRKRVLSESMGGGGWATTLQEFKRGINVSAAMGINFFTLHGFYSEIDHQGSQADWPASFFCHNPYWKYFRIFADHIRRLSYMGAAGRPVTPVGVLYPIGTMWESTVGGRLDRNGERVSREYTALLHHLLENQIDADPVDETSLADARVTDDGQLARGDAAFRVLFVPNAHRLEPGTAAKLQRFEAAGGTIVLYGGGENRAAPWARAVQAGCDPQRWLAAAEAAGGRTFGVEDGDARELYGYKRMWDDGRTYFLVVNGTPKPRSFTARFRANGRPALWDPETAETRTIRPLPAKEAGWTRLRLKLEADQAVFVVFDAACDGAEETPEKAEAAAPVRKPLTGWKVVPADPKLDTEWTLAAPETVLRLPVARFRTQPGGTWTDIRICNRDGESGSIGRYATNWEASWITRRPSWACDSAEPALFFRRKLRVAGTIREAAACVTAVNRFELYVNGRLTARGAGWDDPKLIDLTGTLTPGENTIAVKVMNDTPATGPNLLEVEKFEPTWLTSLLFQLRLREIGGGERIVVSDSDWTVAKREEPGWFEPDYEGDRDAPAIDVKEMRSFGDRGPVWIRAWERGKPPLLPWGHVPLFGERLRLPLRFEYEIDLPAGATRLYAPQGAGIESIAVRLHSREAAPVDVTGALRERGWAELPDDAVAVAIGGTARDLTDGLAAPVEVAVRERPAALEPWERWRLGWLSGRVQYRSAFRLAKEEAKRTVTLELGDVRHHAEVWVNGCCVRTLLWAPYRADLTGRVREGDNEICVVVSNLIANRMRHSLVDEGRALGWNRYWMEDNIDRDRPNLTSGLLGPVEIVIGE